jgi:hydroxymethylglutaryl-CoA synthase
MELYFPRLSVKQSDLETYMGAGEGKFTIGLGQQNMAFCNDLEDINSVCMTAVAVCSRSNSSAIIRGTNTCIQNLLEKYNIAPTDIGRLEVGTETIIDKSKSVKTTL